MLTQRCYANCEAAEQAELKCRLLALGADAASCSNIRRSGSTTCSVVESHSGPCHECALGTQSQWEDAQAVIADAVSKCAAKPLLVAVGATAHLGVPRALASQGWLSNAAMVTVGTVRAL